MKLNTWTLCVWNVSNDDRGHTHMNIQGWVLYFIIRNLGHLVEVCTFSYTKEVMLI